MVNLEQWHPVYPSRWLGKKPVALKRFDEELVLFRTGRGEIGALPDCCPHRGMRLSNGWVEGGQVVCPYHGWCFDRGGDGHSPGTPRMHVQSPCYDAAEHRGMIWIKNRSAAAEFPPLHHDGYEIVHLAYAEMNAPMEALLENFNEIEHTGVAHFQFGYDQRRMHEVAVEMQTDDEGVRLQIEGPQMRMPLPSRWSMGLRRGDLLKFDFTTRFSPVHTTADFWWEDPRTQEVRPCRFKEAAFFIPVSSSECLLVCYYFWTWRGVRRYLRHLFKPFVSLAVRYEISRDKWLIENVMPASLDSERCLGRFDKGLREQRKRLRQLSDAAATAAAATVTAADEQPAS